MIDHLSNCLSRLPLDVGVDKNNPEGVINPGTSDNEVKAPPPLPGCMGPRRDNHNHDVARRQNTSDSNGDLDVHHVNAYFKPSLLSTCARCHSQFFNNPRLFNNPNANFSILILYAVFIHSITFVDFTPVK